MFNFLTVWLDRAKMALFYLGFYRRLPKKRQENR